MAAVNLSQGEIMKLLSVELDVFDDVHWENPIVLQVIDDLKRTRRSDASAAECIRLTLSDGSHSFVAAISDNRKKLNVSETLQKGSIVMVKYCYFNTSAM